MPPETLAQTDRNLSSRQTENCPTDRKKTVSVTERKLSSSNKEKNNIKRANSESKDNRTAYGSYQNVFLTAEELSALQSEVPHYQEYIEKLSRYMASSGKQYANHAATIRSWALQTILLLSDELMNVRRTKAYEANSKYCGRFISAERACGR